MYYKFAAPQQSSTAKLLAHFKNLCAERTLGVKRVRYLKTGGIIELFVNLGRIVLQFKANLIHFRVTQFCLYR